MPQVLGTASFGTVAVERSWAARNPQTHQDLHLGLLANGVYCHIPSGLPIAGREELEACIPEGRERDRALAWLEGRDVPEAEKHYVRKVYPDPESGDWRYMDTHQTVDNHQDLLAVLKGPTLEAAMMWFHQYHRQQRLLSMDAEAQAPKLLDERLIDAVAESPWQTGEALRLQLSAPARDTIATLERLVQQGKLVKSGKVYATPQAAEQQPY